MVSTLDVTEDELRKKTLDAAKRHKASWIELGQFLYSIHKDKLYKGWGFLAFETYCKKELGLKDSTAAKLLKSYLFLEKEEPRLAAIPNASSEEKIPDTIPSYESVNLLRLAKENKNIPTEDFAELRQSVIREAKEPKEVRAQMKKIIEEQNPRSEKEVRKTKRNAAIKRLVSTLMSTKMELESDGLLPGYLAKQMNELMEKLKAQIEE